MTKRRTRRTDTPHPDADDERPLYWPLKWRARDRRDNRPRARTRKRGT